ncbi:MAG: VIT1/CCC1 transporter family protein [Bacteroidia bacterium]|nr:VIT1/CCC1 transporter family protein [Bacteroidia bacterium]
MQNQDFHLHHSHAEEHFTGSETVRDIVIGMSDGLTVPFALAAGLSGAVSDNWIIVTAGIAEIIAGSIAMGLGGYLAGKTEYDHYFSELKREYEETHTKPEAEKQEIRDVLGEFGISPETQEAVVNELSQNRDKWVEFMMKFELGLEEPHLNRARKSAMVIALSYIAGGFVPLIPYVFTHTPEEGLIYSIIITLIALFAFGFFKSKATGQPPFTGALKTMSIGALAAGAAFIIAKSLGGEH